MPFVCCWFWNHWVHIYKTASSKCVQSNKFEPLLFSSPTNFILSSFMSTMTGTKIILTWLLYPRPFTTKKKNLTLSPTNFFARYSKEISFDWDNASCFVFLHFSQKICFYLLMKIPNHWDKILTDSPTTLFYCIYGKTIYYIAWCAFFTFHKKIFFLFADENPQPLSLVCSAWGTHLRLQGSFLDLHQWVTHQGQLDIWERYKRIIKKELFS